GLFDADPDGDKRAVAEMRRITKDQGMLVLTVPFGKEHSVASLHQRTYDMESLEALLRGWRVEDFIIYAASEKYLWERIDPSSIPHSTTRTECAALVRA